MDTLFIILGTILLIAWIGGLLVSVPAIWENFIGDLNLKWKMKKPLVFRKKSTVGKA